MIVTVRSCQRCGQDHKDLNFEVLSNSVTEWTHWAMCPIVMQRILLQIVDDENKDEVDESQKT